MLKKIINTLEKFLPEEETPKKKEDTPNTENEQISIDSDALTPTHIAKHFNTTAIIINKAFETLLYANHEKKWWICTELGIANGGIQKYNTKNKQKYIVWKKEILENKDFLEVVYQLRAKKKDVPEKKTPTTYKEKIKKGAKYEEYVASVYKERDYFIWEHGKEKGLKDMGIDLIVKKENKIILIQCKNWKEKGKWNISHKDIKVLRTEGRDFIERNPVFKGYDLTVRYTLSGDFLHKSAIKYIEECGKNVDYEILRMDKNKEN